MTNKLISFIIPCYRSANSINQVIDEIEQKVAERSEFSCEIICVNDNSPDNVWQVLQDRVKRDPLVSAIDLACNFGQHAALMAGYRHASGDYIFSLDDDGEAPVDAVYLALDKLLDGNYDIVIGKYEKKNYTNLFRCFGSYFANWMRRTMLRQPDDLFVSTFHVMHKFVKDEICKYQGCYPFMSGLIFRTTLNCANIDVKHRKRISGSSGYNFRKLFSLWLNGFTAFSIMPLRLASLLGFVSSALGILYAFVTVIQKILNPSMHVGYASMMAVLLVTSGLIMLILGMIGEYVGRTYICMNNAPQYVIRRIIGTKDEKSFR